MKALSSSNKKNFFIFLGFLAGTFLFPKTGLAISKSHEKNKSSSVAEQLDWVVSNDPQNVCHGYFIQPALDTSGAPILPAKDSLTQISADAGSLSQKKPSVLTGDIVVLQPGRRLTAEKATIYPAKNGKYKAVELTGDVKAWQPGELFLAKSGYFNLIKKSHTLNDVTYRVILAKEDQMANQLTPINKNTDKLDGTVAWGKAKKVKQLKPKHSVLSEVTYSTCAPDTRQWNLISSQIKLNRETEEGTAKNVRLAVGGVPVFYWPYLSFPLTNARKSGFLFPIIGNTNQSGFELGLPYYWNIAPNYDDTITPTYYSKRGVMFVNDFRYLTTHSNGHFYGTFLPNDKAFREFQSTAAQDFPGQEGLDDLLNDSDNRYALAWKDNTSYDAHWSSNVDFGTVSDDYYFQDFGTFPEEITLNQVTQTASVDYVNTHWKFSTKVQGYQTLHPVNRVPVGDPYARLPEIKASANYPDFWKGFDFTFQTQNDYFLFPAEETTRMPEGTRLEVRPGISYPINWIWGFLDPQIQVDATNYQLSNRISPDLPNEITRSLPILDLRSGLFFERDLHLGAGSYEQTLEPELYYLYIPFKNQSNIPIFDSGIIPFTYSQLFATNRFSGLDRIGDANQLTLALTSRFINNQTGEQKFRFSVGDILYFKEPQIQLCDNPANASNPDCRDFDLGLGAAPDNEPVSPIAGLMTYNVTRALSFNAGYAWDPNLNQSITGSFYLSYIPAFNHIFQIGYSFIRNGDIVDPQDPNDSANNLNQISLDGAWPLNANWSLVGIFNYNISQDHPQTYLGGLEYNSCCFRIRFVGGRVFAAINQNQQTTFNNAIYLQIQLKGLGNIGTNNISNILTSNLNGYVDPFQSNSFGNFNL